MGAHKGKANNKINMPTKLSKTGIQKKAGKRMKYDPQKTVNAMEAVEYGTINVTEASKVFDIPRQTLSDRMNGIYKS